MALTRAQYVAGNTADGVVLPGQPQGVRQGAGITIDTNGIISVNGDDPGINTLVRTNNATAYNDYVWPNGPIPAVQSVLSILPDSTLEWITGGEGGIGTVTSIDVVGLSSGVGAGISTSGGPVTSSGIITVIFDISQLPVLP